MFYSASAQGGDAYTGTECVVEAVVNLLRSGALFTIRTLVMRPSRMPFCIKQMLCKCASTESLVICHVMLLF